MRVTPSFLVWKRKTVVIRCYLPPQLSWFPWLCTSQCVRQATLHIAFIFSSCLSSAIPVTHHTVFSNPLLKTFKPFSDIFTNCTAVTLVTARHVSFMNNLKIVSQRDYPEGWSKIWRTTLRLSQRGCHLPLPWARRLLPETRIKEGCRSPQPLNLQEESPRDKNLGFSFPPP